jgi:ribulose-5-phosphate 4-epimerase/fuculose-1-phosphate aldolase
MENHGLVSMTRGSIWETLMNVQILEMTAQMLILALQAGQIKELDRQAIRDLSNTMRTRDLSLMGTPGVNSSLEALYFD